jgi:SET and MYND domain-containing protein 4
MKAYATRRRVVQVRDMVRDFSRQNWNFPQNTKLLAFANKSAVYFEMKMFDRCLNNIEMAKKNNYPEKSWDVLNTRMEKCNQTKKNCHQKPSGPWAYFKLSYPPKKNIPYIADCLQVESNEKYGRFVTASCQLKVGDVIVIEKPFCSVLMEESNFGNGNEKNIFQRCTNCLKENELDLIPCFSCCKGIKNYDTDYTYFVNYFSFNSSNVLLPVLS